MTQNFINIGALPNDGAGDPLRTAFEKINNNFTQLFETSYYTSNAYSTGVTSGQVIFEAPVATFTQGTFQINSNDTLSNDTENITLTVSVAKDGSNLQWSGHSTLFYGNVLTGYDVDIVGSNVRILVNPLVNTEMFHFISSQITWSGVPVAAPLANPMSATMNINTESNSDLLITHQQSNLNTLGNIIDIENTVDSQTENQLTIFIGVLADDKTDTVNKYDVRNKNKSR